MLKKQLPEVGYTDFGIIGAIVEQAGEGDDSPIASAFRLYALGVMPDCDRSVSDPAADKCRFLPWCEIRDPWELSPEEETAELLRGACVCPNMFLKEHRSICPSCGGYIFHDGEEA